MNLTDLLEKLVAEQGPKEVKLPGDRTMHLRPLSPKDGIELGKYLQAKGYDKSGDEAEADVATRAFMVSKSAVELQKVDGKNQWVKTLDHDKGRHLLAQLAAGTLMKLFQHVQRISDLEVVDDPKHDSPAKSDLPENSASPAASDTATPKNYGNTLAGDSGSSG
jgi:hypothetical protein